MLAFTTKPRFNLCSKTTQLYTLLCVELIEYQDEDAVIVFTCGRLAQKMDENNWIMREVQAKMKIRLLLFRFGFTSSEVLYEKVR